MSAQPTRPLNTILVVIDPTRLVQPALERAEWIASRNGAVLHLFCCLWDSDVGADTAAQELAVTRAEEWLRRIADSSRQKGLDAVVRVEWHSDWRGRIAGAAEEIGADLIVKLVSRHSYLGRRLTRTSDWILMRDANCPTLLVDEARPANPKTVLAAVKLNPNDAAHTVLNERVIDTAHRIADGVQAELHAATVYKGDDLFFDRQKFATSCGLPRNRVHSSEGKPAAGIAEIAASVDADVVVIGCAAGRTPARGVAIGNTAQRIIDEVTADVVVIPA